MARRYEGEISSGGIYEAWNFFRSRFLRLYPLIFIASLVGLPWLFAVESSHPWIVAAACLLLLPVQGRLGAYMLNPPAWSIAYELMANLYHAALVARMRTPILIICCIFLGVALVVATRGQGLAVLPTSGNLLAVLLRTLAPYGMGVVLYRLWHDHPPVRVGPLLTWTVMPVFFVVGTALMPNFGAVDYLFVIIVCPLLIAGGLQNGSGSAIARFAGSLSFPLYAIHGPIVLSFKYLGLAWYYQLGGGVLAGLAALQISKNITLTGEKSRSQASRFDLNGRPQF